MEDFNREVAVTSVFSMVITGVWRVAWTRRLGSKWMAGLELRAAAEVRREG